MARAIIRIRLGVLLLCCRWHTTTAFWSTLPRRTGTGGSTTAAAAAGGGGTSSFLSMAPLSNEEIFARAVQHKQKATQADGMNDVASPPPPKIFDDHMLLDMRGALLLLEKRVKEGPLTILEVDQLTSQLDKIRSEMKENQHKKPPRPSSSSSSSLSSSYPTTTTTTTRASAPNVIDIDTPSDEGRAYDGRGGLGQAADTANTYIIPGMDEMTADEYRIALDKTIIERQRQRRYSGDATGNRSSWNYLNSLTGETGILKKGGKGNEGNAASGAGGVGPD